MRGGIDKTIVTTGFEIRNGSFVDKGNESFSRSHRPTELAVDEVDWPVTPLALGVAVPDDRAVGAAL